MSAYTEALLLRLEHMVAIRRDSAVWDEMNDAGQLMLLASLQAAMQDALDEGLEQEMIAALPLAEIEEWK